VLRLCGKGRPGIGGGPAGDALIEVGVRPHPTFHRKGDDIEVELPIWLKEAVLGGKIKVPTPTVPVSGGVTDDRQKSPSARATAYRSLNLKNSTWANDSFDY
jgi:DnaJ-class molecular chaperone